jgi:hypothetical protein
MSDTFDAVERLWEGAKPEDKEEYLFRALKCLRVEIKDEIKKICVRCDGRITVCDTRYITKSQAKAAFIIFCVLALGIGIGAGYITFSELVKIAPKALL